MPRFLIKLAEDEYVVWSTVVDAPITWVGTMDDMRSFYKEEYGNSGLRNLEADLELIKEEDWLRRLERVSNYNRAGPNETQISTDEIRKRFASPESYKGYDQASQLSP